VVTAGGKPVTRFRATPVYQGKLDFVSKFVSDRIQKVVGATGFASADGSFRFERLRAGPWTVVVEADGYPRTESEKVDVAAGTEAVAKAVVLPDGHRAAGVVVDASGKPVPNAKVYLSPDVRAEGVEGEEMEGAVEDLDADAVTDEKGAFETGLLSPAVYRLGAIAEGRMPGTLEKLDLRAGSRGDLRVVLPAGGGIVVRLVDAAGKPVSDQRVVFVHEESFIGSEETDDQGVARRVPARTGRWTFAWGSRALAGRGGLDPAAAYEVVRASPGAQEVVVADGTQREATLRLPRLPRVRVRVRVDGVSAKRGLEAGLWTGSAWTSAALDAEGRFEVPNVEPGTCQVYVRTGRQQDAPWENQAVTVLDVPVHEVEVEFGR
jgi:uncharacterized GH25 family protein